MEDLLLENLAENQAFDAALKKSPGVDRIVSRMVADIIFQANAEARRQALGIIERELLDYFRNAVQPAARAIGQRNAARIVRRLGLSDLNDPDLRRRVLFDLRVRDEDRLRIVQTIINDKANTLDNRMAAYWLEPGAGQTEKVKQLRSLHKEMEQRRRDYDRDLEEFHRGERPSRPRRPNLDFDSKFTADVKQGFREQARRSGTDAETAHFVAEGYQELAWVTVNAYDACPDCRKRNGVVGDLKFWDQLGRPGGGKTVCGSACFCMLVPKQTIERDPGLAGGLVTRTPGVLTSDADARRLAENRYPPGT